MTTVDRAALGCARGRTFVQHQSTSVGIYITRTNVVKARTRFANRANGMRPADANRERAAVDKSR